MEYFFLAESDFLARLAHLEHEIPVEDAMGLPKFSSSSLDKAINECRKGIKVAGTREQLVGRRSDMSFI